MKTKGAVRLIKDRKNDERGFSLIEAAIVLAVMGLVIGGIWVAAAAVQSNWREQTAQSQLLTLVSNVRNLYQGQRTFGTPSMTALITAGVIPAEAISSNDAAVNPWGGALTVIAASSAQQFTVQSAGIPDSACVELLTRNIETAQDYGLTAVTAGSGTYDTPAEMQAITPATAVGACSNATSNTMSWTYNLRG